MKFEMVSAMILLACAGCASAPADDDGHGSVVQPPGLAFLPGDESIDSPGGCRFHQYCCNQETGQAAPPGYYWEYCVCDAYPASDPISIPLEGGWTYERWVCEYDWGPH